MRTAMVDKVYSFTPLFSFFFQGDLGAIDQQYDVAISTACGSLDHIVVDTISTGKRCIEFLKKNNVGRANFILLEKMEVWRADTQRKITT